MRENLLLSPFRRLRVRARAGVYSAAIHLAGRGLLWPMLGILSGLTVVIALPIGGGILFIIEAWSLWMYLAGFVLSWIMAYTRSSPVWDLAHFWNTGFTMLGVPTLSIAHGETGGGVSELTKWIVIFGLIVFLMSVVLREPGPWRPRPQKTIHPVLTEPRPEVRDSVPFGAGGGFVVGAALFIWLHLVGGSPRPGDWWWGPAFAALGATVALAVNRVIAHVWLRKQGNQYRS